MYGIRGGALSWFRSYLSDRKQFSSVNGVNSEKLTVGCGVPQGSILGPLLFIIYIHDICNVSNECSLIIFADDTNIFFTGRNPAELENVVCKELCKFHKWFTANKLSLNIDKTNFMVFSSSKYVFNINMNGEPVVRVENTKFLGVYIDSRLTWKEHIHYISKQISKGIGIMSKLKFMLPQKIMRTIYLSLVYPYLTYCSTIWYGTTKSNLSRLQVLQKRAVRMIAMTHYRTRTSPIFAKLNILKLNDIFTLNIATFTYRYHKSLLPSRFENVHTTNQSVHTYNTRHATDLRIDYVRTSHYKYSLKYRSVQIWNNLPENIKSCKTIASFRKCMTNDLKCHY